MKKLPAHKYELPCANCKLLVSLTPEMWLKYFNKKKLPFCSTNGCYKYKKYLSITSIEEGESDFYDNQ
jgi:hypothetical protein